MRRLEHGIAGSPCGGVSPEETKRGPKRHQKCLAFVHLERMPRLGGEGHAAVADLALPLARPLAMDAGLGTAFLGTDASGYG